MARGKKSGAQATATADPVTIQYNGNTISQFTDKGSVKLKCADKRMLSDVEVDYNVENYEPSIVVVPDGDVNIRYNNNLIYSLSDTGHVTIPVRGKRVEYDINVNYEKPAGMPKAIPLTVTNNTSDDLSTAPGYSEVFKVVNGEMLYSVLSEAEYCIAEIGKTGYLADIRITCNTDKYNVTVNGSPVAYQSVSHWYACIIESDTYPTQMNIVVNNKA